MPSLLSSRLAPSRLPACLRSLSACTHTVAPFACRSRSTVRRAGHARACAAHSSLTSNTLQVL